MLWFIFVFVAVVCGDVAANVVVVDVDDDVVVVGDVGVFDDVVVVVVCNDVQVAFLVVMIFITLTFLTSKAGLILSIE